MLHKVMDYQSHSEEETAKMAKSVAAGLQPGAVLALYGDLGAGKSVFCRALIRALCDDPALTVPSPTFSLLQTYEAPMCEIWHFDLYRLEQMEEVYELGWEDACAGNIALIEWPQRIENMLPSHTTKIILEEVSETQRCIKICPGRAPSF